jgi:hypothetical protein
MKIYYAEVPLNCSSVTGKHSTTMAYCIWSVW